MRVLGRGGVLTKGGLLTRTLGTGGVPTNALLLNGQPVTLNGQYITLARAS